MMTWTDDELNRIGSAEELEIASLQSDNTLRKPRTIWVVRHGDDLYVRSVYGRNSGWFRGVLGRHEGQIEAGGVNKNVSFVEVDANDDIHDEIDQAYRAKYRRYAASIVDSTVSQTARSATLRLVPRSANV